MFQMRFKTMMEIIPFILIISNKTQIKRQNSSCLTFSDRVSKLNNFYYSREITTRRHGININLYFLRHIFLVRGGTFKPTGQPISKFKLMLVKKSHR